jgi:hypothetical protein
MIRSTSVQACAALAVAIGVSACNRNETVPESQTTTGVQPTSQTMTVKGCLRAGLAANTFVLTEPASATKETTTYDLAGTAVDFAPHVGQIVEAFGTVRAEQQVATSAPDVVDEPAKGTSGTPTIETSSQLDVKYMTVSSITPTGERCPE